jgi:hypothetical protein
MKIMCTTAFRRGVWGVGYALLAVFASHSASGQVLHESAKLLASDGAANDYFGGSVSISGDVAVVGVAEDDDNGLASGSAYMFRWNPGPPGSWIQEQKLLPSDGAAGDLFGNSVSLSGEVVLIGAFQDGDNGPYTGSAYVFRWNGSSWVQEQKLLASDGSSNRWFGYSVSVSGNVGFVGVAQEYGGAGFTSVYVFRWNGSSWVEEQKLLASDEAQYDLFGSALSVSGDVAVLGARWDDDNGTDSGSAYVFRYNPELPVGSRWVEEQKLLASDGAAGDDFGASVSVSGDVAVVGAALHDHKGVDAGSAYVFRYDPSQSICGRKWCEEQELLPLDGAAGDVFGWVVSVSGDVAVVGAGYDDDNGDLSGSAYVFRWNGSSWVQERKLLPSDGAAGDQFGVGNGVSGNLAVVGARLDDDNGIGSGSAYVFSLVGTCCISNGSCEAAGNCRENIWPSECQALGGRFFGPNLSCTEVCANGACIPTVSTWGIVVLLLLLTTAGTIVLARGRVPAR